MARADSTIRVNIIGDARGLEKAAGKAEGAVGGMNKKLIAAGGLVAGAFAVEAVVDFAGTAVKESDRVGDALGRIEGQLGPDLAKALKDRADDFSALGASEGDMLELEARIIDIGTAAGISSDKLGPLAEDAAEVASAMALATDIPADEWIAKIGKAAASGDARSLRDLGVNLSDSAVAARALLDSGKDLPEQLTDGELAAARQAIIIETLTARYGDVTTAGGDLESKQAELQAKFETLTGKIGEALEGPLTDFITWLLDTAEALDDAGLNVDDLREDIGEIEGAIRTLLSPLATANDLLQEFLRLTGLAQREQGFNGQVSGGPGRTQRGGGDVSRSGPSTTNVYVQGGSPEAIEEAVRRATNTRTRRG